MVEGNKSCACAFGVWRQLGIGIDIARSGQQAFIM